MYSYEYDEESGGLLLNVTPCKMSKEPRPVYYKELDILGFDRFWNYEKDDSAPYMWAEANNYFYRGRKVASTRGGSLYTAPELVIYEEPEPDGAPLRFVDVPTMVEKNRDLLEKLVQETIRNVYNKYVEFKDKVDVFYVAFSGGKDSVVTLDIVQRALPHNELMVLFGDTRMEFQDTYDVIDAVEQKCIAEGIRFERSQSELDTFTTWNTIGPPAQKMRWCCSIHKTAPQILLLRKITENPHFRGMAMMGVRGDESTSRSKYDELNLGTKHQGQYDFYPILSWNSAELFLYIFQEHLILNETYKKGNSRAGCLVCPMEAVKNTWFKEQTYGGNHGDRYSTTFYNDIILEKTFAHELPEDKQKEFMGIGVWKSRHNGAKLSNPTLVYREEEVGNNYVITLDSISTDWKEWLKTIGRLSFLTEDIIDIYVEDTKYTLFHECKNGSDIFTVKGLTHSQKEIYFLSWLKIILRKSAYCITCRVCEANCPNGYISMENGNVYIDDRCVHCKKCYKVNKGCLVAASHLMPKEGQKMTGSVDQYKNMGIQYAWVKEFFEKKETFWDDNALGSQMLSSFNAFLKHAGIAEGKSITAFGKLVLGLGIESESAWALMLANLAYATEFNWWIKNVDFDRAYSSAEIGVMLDDVLSSANSKKNVISAFKNILSTNTILGTAIGLGTATIETKGKNTTLISVIRSGWKQPVSEVILYSLYKFAEKCGDYYQFTLSRLLDHEAESDGVSPTEIFGLDRETMEKLLRGLSINYPEFITADFQLGLDTITLNSGKSSADVLELI